MYCFIIAVHVQVLGTALVHEFHIFSCCTERNLPYSRGAPVLTVRAPVLTVRAPVLTVCTSPDCSCTSPDCSCTSPDCVNQLAEDISHICFQRSSCFLQHFYWDSRSHESRSRSCKLICSYFLPNCLKVISTCSNYFYDNIYVPIILLFC